MPSKTSKTSKSKSITKSTLQKPRKINAKNEDISTLLKKNLTNALKFAGVPVTGYDAGFDPMIGKGRIRLILGSKQKDLGILAGAEFAAVASLLSLPGLTFNGQYLIASK